jgi:hypothetical protein
VEAQEHERNQIAVEENQKHMAAKIHLHLGLPLELGLHLPRLLPLLLIVSISSSASPL